MPKKERNPFVYVIALILGLLLAYFVAKSVIKPIGEATLAKQLPALEQEFQFASYRRR